MKGIVFTTFNDMVEQKIGIDMWESLLESVKPDSGGIYTSIEDFPDQELLDMVTELSKKTNTPAEVLVNAFGQYLFHALAFKHSVFTDEKPDLMEFLKSIESVIHKEVRKLYQNPNLPSIEWEQPTENHLTLYYHSPRKLCHLAEGLIKGAAEHYETKVDIAQTACMLDGAERCIFEIEIV
ncbi:MAG: heme NO-binding domain-containing protein [Pseudohongiellaceae bacterium]